MSTPSTTQPSLFHMPLQALDALLGTLEMRFAPPPWVVTEAQQRMVLLLNHVLQNEAEAMARLKRQQGKTVLLNWRTFSLQLVATPAGLLDLSVKPAPHDLTLTLTQTALHELAAAVQMGSTPSMRIEGDVQLAAEVGWLTQHVRWDLEDDLARVLGNAPAHTLAQAARGMAESLKSFIAKAQPAAAGAK